MYVKAVMKIVTAIVFYAILVETKPTQPTTRNWYYKNEDVNKYLSTTEQSWGDWLAEKTVPPKPSVYVCNNFNKNYGSFTIKTQILSAYRCGGREVIRKGSSLNIDTDGTVLMFNNRIFIIPLLKYSFQIPKYKPSTPKPKSLYQICKDFNLFNNKDSYDEKVATIIKCGGKKLGPASDKYKNIDGDLIIMGSSAYSMPDPDKVKPTIPSHAITTTTTTVKPKTTETHIVITTRPTPRPQINTLEKPSKKIINAQAKSDASTITISSLIIPLMCVIKFMAL